ncbi:Crp/Fnr family transcriptional regulator [Aestuariivirga sp.]|uniref:Crp/Fnr family transcriptional regulator n=1 Tax=Aestuariivirga sp. TaxID=2650926 RepID=UPI0039E2EA39
MSVKADAETLRSIPIFSECDPMHLQLIAFSSERQSFAPGALLIEQGQTGTAAFLVLNGQADLFDGREHLIGAASPGAFLGETAMIGAGAYAVTARARTPLTAARISRGLFMRVAEEYPEFGQAVFRALGARLGGLASDLLAARPAFDQAKPFSRL